VLKEGSISYNNWVETPIPMYFEIYLFNWTNSDRVLEWRTEKPHFAEMGPYVFLEKHYRRNVAFNDNHTVTFNTERVYEFVPEMSAGTLDDNITNLNTIDVVSKTLKKKFNVSLAYHYFNAFLYFVVDGCLFDTIYADFSKRSYRLYVGITWFFDEYQNSARTPL
jgi:hypothetical protein